MTCAAPYPPHVHPWCLRPCRTLSSTPFRRQLIPDGRDADAAGAPPGLVDAPFPTPTKPDVGVRAKAVAMANSVASLRSAAESVQQKGLRSGTLATASMHSTLASVAAAGDGAGDDSAAPLPAYLSLSLSSGVVSSPTSALFSPLAAQRSERQRGQLLQPLPKPVGLAGGTVEVSRGGGGGWPCGGGGRAGRLATPRRLRGAPFRMHGWRVCVAARFTPERGVPWLLAPVRGVMLRRRPL
jgi:hypothetical protein